MKCVSCQADIVDTAKFCPECGASQRIQCPSCLTIVAAAARFCSECGAGLQGSQQTASPAVSKPAPLPGVEVVPERRHLSVLFCDLVGSVELSRRLDAEDFRDVVQTYRNLCAESVERHGGTIAQFHGDGVVVYFGYPIAQEGDARRAVQTGLDITQGVHNLAESVHARLGVDLAVRVAVNTGLAIVGDPDGAAGVGRLALGDTPNIAARVQQLAQPNSVVISEFTHRLVSGYFRLHSLGHHLLKGMDRPLECFEVEAASGARHRLEATSQARLAPYVGRDRTIASLVKAWLAARECPGHAVLLTGDPGVGKSRLLSEFRRSIHEDIDPEQCDILECYCSPYYADTSLFPLIAPLRETLGIERASTAAEAFEALREQLEQRGCEMSTALPLLAKLFGLPADAGPSLLGMHPLTQKQKTLNALITLLVSRAKARPTLIVIEDLHWVDATTIELLGALLRELPNSRLLLLLTSRPGFAPGWIHDAAVTLIPVSPLSALDTELLIQRVVGSTRQLPSTVVNLLVEKTDGNPLYVEEMTRMLLESGVLRQSSEGDFQLSGPLPDTIVPDSLQDLLMARLDRMPIEGRKVLQLGSCIGRDWSFELLNAIFPEEQAILLTGIDQLLEKGIIHSTGDGFTIRHALIQDASYDSMLRRTRQGYHTQIATYLEREASGEVLPERIAQHWVKADQAVRSVPFWLDAGRRAVASSAMVEAENHLRKGLEAAQSIADLQERHRTELALLSTLGVALTMLKGWAAPDVAEVYQRAQRISEQVGPNPQLFWVLWGIWAFYLVKSEQRKAIDFAYQMMRVADAENSPALRLEAHFAIGLSQYYMGQLDFAHENLEAAVALYDPDLHHPQAYLTGQDVGVSARSVSAMVLLLRGYTTEGLARAQEAVDLADRVRHPFSQGYALGCAAWIDAYAQRHDSMKAHALRNIEISTQQSLGFWTIWGNIFAGRAQVAEGQIAEGSSHIRDMLVMYRGIGSGMVVPYFLTMLAEVETLEGNLTGALDHLDEARQTIETSGESFMAAEVERLEARIRLLQLQTDGSIGPEQRPRKLEEVLDQFEFAAGLAERQGNRLFVLRAVTQQAEATAYAGRPTQPLRQRLQTLIESYPDRTVTKDLESALKVLAALTPT